MSAFIPDQLDQMSTKDLLKFAQTAHEENVKLSKRVKELESYNVKLANESHEYQQRCKASEDFIAVTRGMFLDLDDMEVDSKEYADLLQDLFTLFCGGEDFQKYVNKFALEQKCKGVSELNTYFVNRANKEGEMLPIYFPDWCNDFCEKLRKEQTDD